MALWLAGCALTGNEAARLGAAADMAVQPVRGGAFTLFALVRWRDAAAPLRVYIEGDGVAWESRTRLSRDPTPRDATGLKLALADPAPNVAYLARPCQYLGAADNPACTPEMWSSHRFSTDVVAATDAALTALLGDRKVPLELVGYSGGGAVALLVAAGRKDVRSVRTAAGNLDHDLVMRHHQVSPLSGSRNPVEVAPALARLPQWHFVGKDDDVVPPAAAESYRRHSGPGACIAVQTVDAGHAAGWVDRWPDLLRQRLPC